LKSRLTILESHLLAKGDRFPSVVFGETNRADGEIVGIGCNGKNVERMFCETVEELIARGGRTVREKILFFIYVEGRGGDTCVVRPLLGSPDRID
jgi:hypothetical protein